MKNKLHIFIIYALILVTVIGSKLYVDYQDNMALKKMIVKEESQSLSALTLSLRQIYQKVFIDNKIPVNDTTINLLPVRTATTIAEKFSDLINTRTSIRTVSDRPRNPANKANETEMKIIRYFNQNPDSTYYFEDKDSVYFYAVPLRIKQSCLRCHGKRENVLPIIRNKYKTAYNYKIGELRGIINIKMGKKKMFETIIDKQKTTVKAALFIYFILLLLGYFVIKIILKDEQKFAKKLEEQVSEKTKELKRKNEDILALNEELNQNLEELTTVKENLEKQKQIIQESEQKFKTIFESSFAGISILTPAGIHIDVNPNCEQIHGYTREELIGKPFRMFSIEEDVKKTRQAIFDLLENKKEKVELDLRIKHKITEEIIWIHAIITKYKLKQTDKEYNILVIFNNITKLKQAEQELKQSEEKFQSIINKANDAIILVDNEEKISLWNQTAENIFGYTNKEVIGENVHDILPDYKYRDKAHKSFSLFRLSGKGNAINKTLELEGLRKNGEVFPLELSLSAFKINDKWHAVGIIRDISMRKQYEAELQTLNSQLIASEEELKQQNEILYQKNEEILQQRQKIEEVVRQFEDTIKNLEDVYFRADRNFIHTQVSPSIKKYLKIDSLDKIIGKPLTEYWNISDNDIKKITIKLLKEKNIKDLLFEYKTFDKEIRYAKINARALFKNNKFDGVEGIIRDVTADIEYQNKINELNSQKDVLINNIPSAIFYKNIDLEYIEVNKTFARLLNKSSEEIIGKTDKEVAPEQITSEYEEIDRKVIKTKKPIVNYVKQHLGLDNKYHWMSTSKYPYLNSENQVAGIIGVIRDITKQVEHEKAIKESKEKIEQAHKHITDNINYAKRIQQALLPSEEIINSYLKESFVFFKPKEAVSGDFYFYKKFGDEVVFAAADCTGHGVSGGFLTMLGITHLNDIVNRKDVNEPAQVLNVLREKIKDTYKLFGTETKDGLDIALCALNTKTYTLKYAGAFNPLWIIRNDELIEYKAVRNPIGFYYKEKEFITHIIQLQKNDTIYIFSDGFADQFGGEFDKKYTPKRFKEFLISINKYSMKEQKTLLNEEFNKWKGNNEQTDDVVILGVRV